MNKVTLITVIISFIFLFILQLSSQPENKQLRKVLMIENIDKIDTTSNYILTENFTKKKVSALEIIWMISFILTVFFIMVSIMIDDKYFNKMLVLIIISLLTFLTTSLII